MADELKPDPDETVTDSGIILPNFKGEQEHVDDLERYFSGLARIEKKMPQLVDFAFKLSHALKAWCDEKQIATRAVKLGTIFWTPTGDIAFDIEYDPYDLTPNAEQEYLKTGYARLPLLAEQYPCLVDLVDTLSYSLIAMIDNKTLSPAGATFKDLRPFFNVLTRKQAWSFRLYDAKGHKVKSRIGGIGR
jgi:hypothetical protein